MNVSRIQKRKTSYPWWILPFASNSEIILNRASISIGNVQTPALPASSMNTYFPSISTKVIITRMLSFEASLGSLRFQAKDEDSWSRHIILDPRRYFESQIKILRSKTFYWSYRDSIMKEYSCSLPWDKMRTSTKLQWCRFDKTSNRLVSFHESRRGKIWRSWRIRRHFCSSMGLWLWRRHLSMLLNEDGVPNTNTPPFFIFYFFLFPRCIVQSNCIFQRQTRGIWLGIECLILKFLIPDRTTSTTNASLQEKKSKYI